MKQNIFYDNVNRRSQYTSILFSNTILDLGSIQQAGQHFQFSMCGFVHYVSFVQVNQGSTFGYLLQWFDYDGSLSDQTNSPNPKTPHKCSSFSSYVQNQRFGSINHSHSHTPKRVHSSQIKPQSQNNAPPAAYDETNECPATIAHP